MNITTREWTRPASRGEGEVFSRLWAPENPRAILMIAHGMAEHSARYDAFARHLANEGWVVCMNDHIGHGRSSGPKGFFAEENGWDCVVKDLRALLIEVKRQYPKLPVCMMGHSMGSFLTREYITRWGDELSGCVICGTMGKNPALAGGLALAKLQCKVKGPKSPGKLLDKMSTGGFYKKIPGAVNEFAWLSLNEQNCIDYKNDPLCGCLFTASAFRDMFSGVQAVTGAQWANRVPKNLPIYVVAGAEDPVGANGQGPSEVARWLRDAGVQDVTLKLYDNMRHEILNETNRAAVFRDIALWLDSSLPD